MSKHQRKHSRRLQPNAELDDQPGKVNQRQRTVHRVAMTYSAGNMTTVKVFTTRNTTTKEPYDTATSVWNEWSGVSDVRCL